MVSRQNQKGREGQGYVIFLGIRELGIEAGEDSTRSDVENGSGSTYPLSKNSPVSLQSRENTHPAWPDKFVICSPDATS